MASRNYPRIEAGYGVREIVGDILRREVDIIVSVDSYQKRIRWTDIMKSKKFMHPVRCSHFE